MKREALLATARKHMWAAWQLSGEELASQAAETLIGLGMLVEEGGAQELEKLRSRVEELLAERHSTNESLSEAAEQLRVDRDRIAELETAPLAWAEKLDAKSLDNLLISLGSATEHEPMGEAIAQIHQVLAGFREAALDLPAPIAPELVVFRAQHDSIVMGLYTTAAVAREHCEALLLREWPNTNLDWIEDEEDGVAELVAMTGGEETETGYVVTALEVASAYDPDADE